MGSNERGGHDKATVLALVDNAYEVLKIDAGAFRVRHGEQNPNGHVVIERLHFTSKACSKVGRRRTPESVEIVDITLGSWGNLLYIVSMSSNQSFDNSRASLTTGLRLLNSPDVFPSAMTAAVEGSLRTICMVNKSVLE